MTIRQNPTIFFKGAVQPAQAGQADYSYDQWRHAQMRQMEGAYAAQCERDQRSFAGPSAQAE